MRWRFASARKPGSLTAAWKAARSTCEAIRRYAGRCQIGPVHRHRRKHELEDLLRALVLGELGDRGNVGEHRIAFERNGDRHDDLLLREPVGPRRIDRRDERAAAALHLAAFHREIDLVAALVAGDHLVLRAEQFVQHHRHRFHLRAGAGTADDETFGRHVLPRPDARMWPTPRRCPCSDPASPASRICAGQSARRTGHRAARTARWSAPCR